MLNLQLAVVLKVVDIEGIAFLTFIKHILVIHVLFIIVVQLLGYLVGRYVRISSRVDIVAWYLDIPLLKHNFQLLDPVLALLVATLE